MGPKTKTQAAGATGKEQAPARSIQSYFITTKAGGGGGGAPAAGAGSTPTTAPKKRASPCGKAEHAERAPGEAPLAPPAVGPRPASGALGAPVVY